MPPDTPGLLKFSPNHDPYFVSDTYVRFYRADGSSWIGNFLEGWSDFKCVIPMDHSARIVLVVKGICYVVDPEQAKLISAFGVVLKEALKTEDDRVVLQDDAILLIVEADGRYWETVKISWDGIIDLKLSGHVVSGLAFTPSAGYDEWLPFTYDLDNKRLTGGSYRVNMPKKPWWKFFFPDRRTEGPGIPHP